MHLRAFASSSRGNCSLLYDQDTALLVDAGISCRKIKQRLQAAELTPDDLSGILITHEHTDHIAGLAVLLKNYPIPLYATPGTALVLSRKLPHARELIRPLPAGSQFQVGSLTVQSFSTSHDAADSVGYRLTSGGHSAVIATDLGRVTSLVMDAAFGADLALIEANHDVDWLRDGPLRPAKPYLGRPWAPVQRSQCGICRLPGRRRNPHPAFSPPQPREQHTGAGTDGGAGGAGTGASATGGGCAATG